MLVLWRRLSPQRGEALMSVVPFLFKANESNGSRHMAGMTQYPFLGNRSFRVGCVMRSFFPTLSMTTITGTDDFISKGKALSSTRLFGRYTKYFPSFLLDILPWACATTNGHPRQASNGSAIALCAHLKPTEEGRSYNRWLYLIPNTY